MMLKKTAVIFLSSSNLLLKLGKNDIYDAYAILDKVYDKWKRLGFGMVYGLIAIFMRNI